MDGPVRFQHVCTVTLLLTLAAGGTARADGILERVRSEVRGSTSRPSGEREEHDDGDKKKRNRRRHTHDHCEDDNPFAVWIGHSFLAALSAPWVLPHALLNDDCADRAEFPPAPYAEHDGFLLIVSAAPGKWWSGRLSLEYGHDFDDLSRAGARLIVDTSSRFGFDTEWNQWIERVPGGYDSLATGDFNLVFRFAQHEQIEFHSGLGFNWLADSSKSDFGFNFTYGVDLFPRKPWIISSTIDWGTLGRSSLFQNHTSVGLIFGGTEFFTGFNYLRIGRADLHGLTAGVRFWY